MQASLLRCAQRVAPRCIQRAGHPVPTVPCANRVQIVRRARLRLAMSLFDHMVNARGPGLVLRRAVAPNHGRLLHLAHGFRLAYRLQTGPRLNTAHIAMCDCTNPRLPPSHVAVPPNYAPCSTVATKLGLQQLWGSPSFGLPPRLKQLWACHSFVVVPRSHPVQFTRLSTLPPRLQRPWGSFSFPRRHKLGLPRAFGRVDPHRAVPSASLLGLGVGVQGSGFRA